MYGDHILWRASIAVFRMYEPLILTKGFEGNVCVGFFGVQGIIFDHDTLKSLYLNMCQTDLARWLTRLPADLDGDKLFRHMHSLESINEKKIDTLMKDSYS